MGRGGPRGFRLASGLATPSKRVGLCAVGSGMASLRVSALGGLWDLRQSGGPLAACCNAGWRHRAAHEAGPLHLLHRPGLAALQGALPPSTSLQRNHTLARSRAACSHHPSSNSSSSCRQGKNGGTRGGMGDQTRQGVAAAAENTRSLVVGRLVAADHSPPARKVAAV